MHWFVTSGSKLMPENRIATGFNEWLVTTLGMNTPWWNFAAWFYPNVTTLRSGLCYRKSVCLYVVCNVRAPYSRGWNFRQYYFAILYLSHPFISCKILQRSSERNPSVEGVKHKRGSKIERCHVRVSHLLMTFRRYLKYSRIYKAPMWRRHFSASLRVNLHGENCTHGTASRTFIIISKTPSARTI